ncbi:MAG TPA: type II secretion system protein [Burkholderiaceae bacterium]|jgi:general secretion pathway protein G
MKRLISLRRLAGFTIIELLASVAILGILASVAMPIIQTSITREKEAQLRAALMNMRNAIDAYKQATVSGSITINKGQSGYPPSLTALVGGVQNANNPSGPQLYFMRSIPRDPFYPDLTTAAISTWGLRSYDSPPDNPVAGDDVFDVHSMSTQVGLNGIPYNEW